MTFQIQALDPAPFAKYFSMSPGALAASKAVIQTATSSPGFPCRVSLCDAALGERLVLANFEHQPASSPYRATHAVFVREGAAQAHLAPGEVPALFRTRMLSVRAFDGAGMMVDAELVQGTEIEVVLDELLSRPSVDDVHIHFAKPGCFAARAVRVASGEI